MPLELEVADLNGVAEPLREHYQPLENGRFRLSVSGGLKSALDSERAANGAVKAALKEHGLSAADLPELINSRKSLHEMRGKLRAMQTTHELTLALTRERATDEGMELLGQVLPSRVTFESVDGRDVLRISGSDGEPLAGSGADGLAVLQDLIRETVGKFPSLFEGTGKGGGGAAPRGGKPNGGSKIIDRKSFDALPPKERHARINAGFKVVDQ